MAHKQENDRMAVSGRQSGSPDKRSGHSVKARSAHLTVSQVTILTPRHQNNLPREERPDAKVKLMPGGHVRKKLKIKTQGVTQNKMSTMTMMFLR